MNTVRQFVLAVAAPFALATALATPLAMPDVPAKQPATGATIQAAAPVPTKADIVAAARDVMTRARYATLATNGPGTQPQARIVDPTVPDKDMVVWIGTNALTRKLAEIRLNNHVTLLYFDSKGLEYVTLLGVADVVTDPAEQAKHFKAEWAPFYKKGAASADFALIRVRATRLEVVSPSHKLMNDTTNWRPVGVNLP